MIGANRFSFEAPQRDPTLLLVIDPELIWSTYWGGVQTFGSIGDSANDVVLDPGRLSLASRGRSRAWAR